MNISIALCTFNGERFLQEQLDSYCDQELLPDELVVCDDCSADSTRSILSTFAKDAPFEVRLEFNETNLGMVRNFERAISLCTGDIICLSDQDDVWHAAKIKRVAEAFESSEDIGMVYSDALVVDEALTPMGYTMWEQIKFSQQKRVDFEQGRAIDWLLKDGHVLGMSMAFRAKFVSQIIPFPEDIYFIHDNWIALVASSLSRVRIIDTPLVHYRQHSDQTSSGMKLFDEPKLSRLMNEAQRINVYDKLIRQMDILQTRLRRTENPPQELIDKISAAIQHFQMRDNLDPKLLARFRQVAWEFKAGGYRRFSNGLRSATKDTFRGKA